LCVCVCVCSLDCTLPLLPPPPPPHTHTQSMWLQCTFCMISTNTVNLFTFMALYFENLYCPSHLHAQLHNYSYTPTHTTKTFNLCLEHCMWMRVGNKNTVLHVYNTVFTPRCMLAVWCPSLDSAVDLKLTFVQQ